MHCTASGDHYLVYAHWLHHTTLAHCVYMFRVASRLLQQDDGSVNNMGTSIAQRSLLLSYLGQHEEVCDLSDIHN